MSKIIATIDWLMAIQTFASLATVVIAYLALKNWKKQDRAKREAEFLDELIEATHAYITIMPRAVYFLNSARVGIICHNPNFRSDKEPTLEGAIAYISKKGETIGPLLREALAEIRPSVVHLRTLGDKGQIFRFSNYVDCVNGIIQMTWQFDRIEAFHNIVSSPTWNWENAEVRSLLEKVIQIDPQDIQSGLSNQHSEILKFVRQTYELLYK